LCGFSQYFVGGLIGRFERVLVLFCFELIKVSKVKVVMNEFDDCWVWLVVICGDDE
jgi:hypothetical protein